MMNTKTLWMTSSILLLAGCNSVDLGFVPLYAIQPEAEVDMTTNLVTSCTFDSGGDPIPFITVDVAQQNALALVVATENRLQEIEIELSTARDEILTIPNHIQPVRFDYRWECDSDGFTAAQGPLRVPAFGADRAFCLDKRDEATGDFSGLNVVPASGAAISPGQTGSIEVRIAPPQLLASIQDSFEISSLADACCNDALGCDNANSGITSCASLLSVFERVGSNQTLDDAANLAQWRSFVYHTSASPNNAGTLGNVVPYNMRIRGRFEGLTATGDLITSTDFVQDIGLCEGCGSRADIVCLDR